MAALETTHATDAGTRRFAQRFSARFVSDFYRGTVLGTQVASIGIGTYLGESDDADDSAYTDSVYHAVASGINLIDTAINYRSQRSELAVGSALQRLFADGVAAREELVVCTKGGYVPLDRVPPASKEAYDEYVRREFIEPEILRPDEIVAGGHSVAPRFLRYCLAKSRQNLGLRTVDVYYVHNPEQQLSAVDAPELIRRLRAAFQVLEEGVDRGEIAAYGIATWNGLRTPPGTNGHLSLVDVVDAARAVAGAGHHFRAIQLPINLALNEAIRTPTQLVDGRLLTVLEAARELKLTVVGSATLLQGRLSSGLPESLAAHFPALATDAQRSVAFARAVPGLAACLVGMRRTAHVDENLIVARPTGKQPA